MVKEIEKIMRTRHIYILSACLAAAFSCTQFEEENIEVNEAQKVDMTFTATICDETDTETKTVLDGQLGDELRKVLWTPEDEIGVAAAGSSNVNKFINDKTEDSETASFKGGVHIADTYYAIYPYEGSAFIESYYEDARIFNFAFNIPQNQTYVEGSFGKDCAPMAAIASYGETLKFRNLCGILALNLTGVESIKSITFTGKDANGDFMYVSGDFVVEMNDDTPSIIAGAKSQLTAHSLETYKSVTLECEEPVQLNESEATPFYFVLPPATYESFIITILTEDGKLMMKEGTKPLTIKRSDVQPTADLAYVESVSINLSENGIANCYIVPQAGLYSFNAKAIGNGEFGLVEGATFHTRNTAISPVSAELLWCDSEGAITGISYDESNGQITFIATGAEGNAVIAAKDSEGNIIWSWHIWMTDQPAEHLYKNSTGQYLVLDRNLGATRADRGSGENDWKEAQGLAYQWGRKDPFTRNRYEEGMSDQNAAYRVSLDLVSVETTIKNPDMFYGSGHSFWIDEYNDVLWSDYMKTIYDPCPVGYRVAYGNVWRSFTKTEDDIYGEYSKYNISGGYDNGWNFIYDGTSTAYYPQTWEIDRWGNPNENNYINIWSSVNHTDTQSKVFRTYYYTESDSHVLIDDHNQDQTYGHMIRCIKEDATKNIYLSVTDVANVTNTSAQVSARIASYGGKEISQTGVVYGTSADVNHLNGTVVSTGKRTGDVSAQLNGLTELTKYYVKTFITTSDDLTVYSEAVSFITPNEAGLIDLSHNGSANCYIVHPWAGRYSIDLVKGNSSESVGEAATAAILWETNNKNTSLEVNSIIESAEIEGDILKFTVSDDAVPGNALIAAMNDDGVILWSWHIWVVDLDPSVTYNTYNNGTVMMDRNLGATSVQSNADAGDYSAFGLYYQWGRKDPFAYLGSVVPEGSIKTYSYDSVYNSIDYATQHPTEVYDGVDWNHDESLWNITKTIYDPCPAGWRVPEKEDWDEWAGGAFKIDNRFKIIEPTYSTPAAYYPHADRIEGLGTTTGFDNGLWWTNTIDNCLYTHSSWGNFEIRNWPTATRMSVRCRMDVHDVSIGGPDIVPFAR